MNIKNTHKKFSLISWRKKLRSDLNKSYKYSIYKGSHELILDLIQLINHSNLPLHT